MRNIDDVLAAIRCEEFEIDRHVDRYLDRQNFEGLKMQGDRLMLDYISPCPESLTTESITDMLMNGFPMHFFDEIQVAFRYDFESCKHFARGLYRYLLFVDQCLREKQVPMSAAEYTRNLLTLLFEPKNKEWLDHFELRVNLYLLELPRAEARYDYFYVNDEEAQKSGRWSSLVQQQFFTADHELLVAGRTAKEWIDYEGIHHLVRTRFGKLIEESANILGWIYEKYHHRWGWANANQITQDTDGFHHSVRMFRHTLQAHIALCRSTVKQVSTSTPADDFSSVYWLRHRVLLSGIIQSLGDHFSLAKDGKRLRAKGDNNAMQQIALLYAISNSPEVYDKKLNSEYFILTPKKTVAAIKSSIKNSDRLASMRDHYAEVLRRDRVIQ